MVNQLWARDRGGTGGREGVAINKVNKKDPCVAQHLYCGSGYTNPYMIKTV